MGEAKDWGTVGIPLKANMLGKMNHLEVHHIFPKSQLYKLNYYRSEVNAVANFCFLTKETNIKIGNQLPEDYFPKVEHDFPGALESQWIPMDKELWKIANYRDFLEARKILLAEETNRRLAELLHGDTKWLEGASPVPTLRTINVGIENEVEEQELMELNKWVVDRNLHPGQISYEYTDQVSGEQLAIFDLAWAEGLQEGLSEPVAVLLNEGPDVLSVASSAGFRCFTSVMEFKHYVLHDILNEIELEIYA